MRILLFGKNGQIGSRLQSTLSPLGQVTAFGSNDVDFRDPDAAVRAVREVHPQLIVNAAAYTAVDDAERDERAATLINGTVPGLLAREASSVGAALVHYSTDYVFDGSKTTPYVEDDTRAPLNAYGRSKLAGEKAIEQSGAVYLTFRTSWVYAATGKNFVLTMLRLARAQSELRVVADQVGCPTSADVVATATADALTAAVKRRPGGIVEALRPFAGTYHVACKESGSWYGFACEIFAQAKRIGLISSEPTVHAITTREFSRPAPRPLNSVLATERFRETFHLELPHWKAALEHVMSELSVRVAR